MFDRCRQKTKIVASKLINRKGPSEYSEENFITKIGNERAANKLEIETIFVSKNVVKNTPNDKNPTFHERPRKTPKPVATALPPLNPNQIGHM